MPNLLRSGAAVLALVGTLAVAAVAPAAAADVTIRIGWATTDSETDAYNFAAHAFARQLEAAKPGHFEVQFFPNRQLGDETALLQGLQLGTVDMAIVTNSVVANIDSAFSVSDLPFLYPSLADAHRVLDGPLGQELFDRLTSKKVIGLGWCEAGFRNMLNRERPINTPEDVVGLKFRVLESPLYVGMFASLGAAGVPMPWGEVFTALQQGAIDGLEAPTWALWAAKMTEAAKFMSVTQHLYAAAPIWSSGRLFDSLSAEDQAIVKAAGRAACIEQRQFNQDYEMKVMEMMKGTGVQINEIADRGAFQAKMQPVWDSYRDKIGADLLERWVAAVNQK